MSPGVITIRPRVIVLQSVGAAVGGLYRLIAPKNRNLRFAMWNVYIVDSCGVFLANDEPMDIVDAEQFCGFLDDGLVFFLLPASIGFPICFSSLRLDD